MMVTQNTVCMCVAFELFSLTFPSSKICQNFVTLCSISLPNMVSSPNQAGVYALSIVLILASTIAIVLRYKARHIMAAAWKSDDWLVSSAMVGRILRNTCRANRI